MQAIIVTEPHLNILFIKRYWINVRQIGRCHYFFKFYNYNDTHDFPPCDGHKFLSPLIFSAKSQQEEKKVNWISISHNNNNDKKKAIHCSMDSIPMDSDISLEHHQTMSFDFGTGENGLDFFYSIVSSHSSFY